MLPVRHPFNMVLLILDTAALLASYVLSTNKRSLKISVSVMVSFIFDQTISFSILFFNKKTCITDVNSNSPWDWE